MSHPIQIKGLRKKYHHHEVLSGIDLEVKQGETLVILGRSGGGKSVLLRLIMGIEKPQEGTIHINGTDIVPLNQHHLYPVIKEMGMLFQGSALFDSLSVYENTAFYLRQHGDPSDGKAIAEKEIGERVSRALAMVGLAGTERLMPSDLSGGMKKRAALARLIVYRPKIILYDEPTTGLDPMSGRQINDLILRTQRELGATSIVVTHDFGSALQVADRIALNHEGKIAHLATKEEFQKIDDPFVKQYFSNDEGKKYV